MKNIKSKSLLVLLLTMGMLYFILKDDFTNIVDILKYTNLIWFLLAIIVYYIGTFIQSIALKIIINQYNKEYTLLKAFRLNVVTNFFNGITPLASGGQPLQVYELHKDRIRVADGTNIIVENFLVYQTALMLLALVCYFINILFDFVEFNMTLTILFYLGLFLNLLILVFAYVVGSSKNISKKIVVTIAKVLAKLNIIKDKTKVINKLESVCDEFYNGFKELKKNKLIILKSFILQLIGIVITFTTSIFVFKALSLNVNMNILECIVISLFTFISGSFIPIPGGTGGMEYTFFGFFGNFIKGASLKSVLLLWRFVTYILPVILGGIIFNIKKENINYEKK